MGNVLLVMGHRNTSGGNAEEAQRTPLVVAAAKRALRNAGHTVHVLQEQDGDGDPNNTFADLAFVGQQCAQLIRQHRIDVMIDAHFQGGTANPTSGCFCIFPDGNQLSPPPPIDDSKFANQRAVAFAQKLATAVSQETGIRLLPLGEPGFLGGMSERQTGVGGQGFRLGMFHLTVPPPACVRVIMEHGDISADAAIINNPGFFDRVANAYVRAVDAFWPVVPVTPEFFAFAETRPFTTQAGAIGRKHASTAADVVRQFGQGETIQCVGYYESQPVDGDNRWLRATGDDAPRVHRSGVLEEIPLGIQSQPPGGEDVGVAAAETPPTEQALAAEQARQRADDPATAQIMLTAALGCDMVSSTVPAAEIIAAAESVTEADKPVGYPSQTAVAEEEQSGYVGIEEHGRPQRDGFGVLSSLTSAVWGKREVPVFTTNGQEATWDPCKPGGTVPCKVPSRCVETDCCWYNYSVDVGLPRCTHPGMDIGVTKHTALYAAAAGTVERVGADGFYLPFHVDIRTTDGELHIYGHMWSIDPEIVKGGQVQVGQFLGTSGEQTLPGTMEPDGSGPHLHFERRVPDPAFASGRAEDPTFTLQQATTIVFCAPSAPPPFDGNPQTIGNTVFHPARRTVECQFDGLGCRRWGSLEACTTRQPLSRGDKVDVLYWVEGENVGGEDRWWVATDGTRLHVGGTVEKPQGG
jgi:murein DD-endopeptidase MepM/ murein hydrolase activator NlpD